MTPASASASLQTQYETILALMQQQGERIGEVKSGLERLSDRVQSLERSSARSDALGTEQMERVRSDLACLTARVEGIERMMPWVRAMAWALPVVGVLAIALMWALLTGQASVVYQ